MYSYKYNFSKISVKWMNEWTNERTWQITHIQTIYICILAIYSKTICLSYSMKSNLYSINYLLLKCHLENWSSWNSQILRVSVGPREHKEPPIRAHSNPPHTGTAHFSKQRPKRSCSSYTEPTLFPMSDLPFHREGRSLSNRGSTHKQGFLVTEVMKCLQSHT